MSAKYRCEEREGRGDEGEDRGEKERGERG